MIGLPALADGVIPGDLKSTAFADREYRRRFHSEHDRGAVLRDDRHG
jgi:hypothetical protein